MNTAGLVKVLWPELSYDMISHVHYKRFLDYIESSLVQSFEPYTGATVGRDEICQILTQIGADPSIDQESQRNIIIGLRAEDPITWDRRDDDWMARSVALCFSLRLSIHITPFITARFMNTTPLRWDNDQTISNLLSDAFPSPYNPLQDEVVDEKLTLEYLSHSYGFKVLFVDNLVDHLVIQRTGDRPWLLVYQHKIFLKNGLRFGSLLPSPLVEEALDTLNLLLPYNDAKTAAFLRSNSMFDFHSLGPCGRSRKAKLSDYKYFRNRLAQLCAVIRDEPPLGVQQLMPGRHGSNLREFLNFWIAAFVGGLTVSSIAFGITALVYAKWAYDVALLQYQLSLAQACAEPDAAKQLPSFC